jgi:glycosyltransferase involved in cell wall biosynthesis
MSRQRIILSVTNDLVTDQRVHRSSTALTLAGYDVVLVGRRLPGSEPLDRPYRTVRMRLLFRRKALFYAEYNLRLLLRLLLSRADAFYANDTDTLPANYVAARLRRKPLFFDAHEMFPEVPELVGRPRVKAVWTHIEDRIFPHLRHCCTVCQSIADIYRERYGVDMKVVRNVPMRSAASPIGSRPAKPSPVRTLLYQGAVNMGRGIEQLIDAMPLLDGCRLLIAGTGDRYDALRSLVRERRLDDRVVFLGRLPLERLRSVTLQADLGLSLLQNKGLNYYYSLPNRIADFAQAGVPVLATDFPEIRRVVEQYGIGRLLPSGDENTPAKLAAAIRATLHEWDSMPDDERQRRFDRAGKELSWDNDSHVLLGQIDAMMRHSHEN